MADSSMTRARVYASASAVIPFACSRTLAAVICWWCARRENQRVASAMATDGMPMSRVAPTESMVTAAAGPVRATRPPP